ncbi:MAG TPA: DinB family protein [Gemmatimonadales bacterium]
MTAPPKYDRPDPSEFPPFYAGYVNGMPDGEILGLMETQIGELTRGLGAVPESRGDFAYAPGKWTLKEVVGHVADSERVFSYRALRIGRGDQTPLPSFDEKLYVPNSGANDRTLADLLAELQAVRASTLALFRHMPAEAPVRKGTAGAGSITVRALAWVIAGHAAHHYRIIRERYL